MVITSQTTATAVGMVNLTTVCMCTAFWDVTLCSVAEGTNISQHTTYQITLLHPHSPIVRFTAMRTPDLIQHSVIQTHIFTVTHYTRSIH